MSRKPKKPAVRHPFYRDGERVALLLVAPDTRGVILAAIPEEFGFRYRVRWDDGRETEVQQNALVWSSPGERGPDSPAADCGEMSARLVMEADDDADDDPVDSREERDPGGARLDRECTLSQEDYERKVEAFLWDVVHGDTGGQRCWCGRLHDGSIDWGPDHVSARGRP